MEERFKKILADEGFKNIYVWHDAPRKVYSPHRHVGKVTLFITKGGITLTIQGVEKVLSVGDRFDVPVGVTHTALVGENGVSYVVGEMIEGDS